MSSSRSAPPRLKPVRRKSVLETLKPRRKPQKRGAFAQDVEVEPKRQYLRPSELIAFFGYPPKSSQWHPYFFLQFFFGCRLSEPALILDDDVKKKKITIRRLRKTKEKPFFLEYVYNADPRVLDAVRVAQEWKGLKFLNDNPFVFASNRQRNTSDVGAENLSQIRNQDGWQAVSRFTANRMFHTIATEIRLPAHLRVSHVLRHTRAPILLASGWGLEEVQDLLGHNTLKMTRRYLKIAQKITDADLNALEKHGLL